MSVERKIKELLESKKTKAQTIAEGGDASNPPQGSSQKAEYTEIDPHTGAAVKPEDTTVKKGPQEPQAKQGDSKDATYDERDGEADENQGAKAAAKVNKFAQPTNSGAGQAPNYSTTADPGSVINQGSSKGNVNKESVEDDAEIITEEDIEEETKEDRKIDMNLEELRKDIASVFSADTNLSEEFKTQASAIFEAAVIARVNNEIEKITEELAVQAAEEVETIKEGLVEKVDSYLNYVVEQWMSDNELAVDSGLRTEIAEDFMLGLKNLFQEHYFEVPEDRIDVLADMSDKVDAATAKLDEAIQVNVELKAELDAIKRDRIVAEASRHLTATDAEKLAKLLEGVEYDNEKLFEEKVKVVKENYFPSGTPASPEQILEEEVANGEKPAASVNPIMERYAATISRSVKK
jgi:hypothetical protein